MLHLWLSLTTGQRFLNKALRFEKKEIEVQNIYRVGLTERGYDYCSA